MEALVKMAKAHDKEAFAELIRQQESSMYKVARAILGNDEDAADAMQEALLICWQKIGTLQKEQYFKTWLTRILINQCYDIRAAGKRLVSSELMVETGKEDAAIRRAEWMELLSHLEDKHRIVLVLYYGEGFKVREIAKILELKETTVKDRLVAARKSVEKMLKAEVAEYGTV
ncbi:MAG: sigma-70 family RNA polymerase sigma factor [Lachnospiraceae bacterium]|nr:sigma-70 family RNA polymerase sigma factor [Lachnospiraceae bacterium]